MMIGANAAAIILEVGYVEGRSAVVMSVAVRLEGSNFTIIQAFSLVGPSMIAVGTGGVTSVDSDVMGPLLKKQVERYVASVQK